MWGKYVYHHLNMKPASYPFNETYSYIREDINPAGKLTLFQRWKNLIFQRWNNVVFESWIRITTLKRHQDVNLILLRSSVGISVWNQQHILVNLLNHRSLERHEWVQVLVHICVMCEAKNVWQVNSAEVCVACCAPLARPLPSHF